LSPETTLLALARERETALQAALSQLELNPPDRLLRELRDYMSRQRDLRRIKPFAPKVVHLMEISDVVQELACAEVEFSSEARLDFNIEMERQQRGWSVSRFRFHLFLPRDRKINMIRIHLNPQSVRDPLRVPRCHFHIGDSRAHVPFPIMPPLLMLDLICRYRGRRRNVITRIGTTLEQGVSRSPLGFPALNRAPHRRRV
jgi:hypothetical protein